MTVINVSSKARKRPKSKANVKRTTLKNYLKLAKREDGYKYEYTKGILEKSYHTMTPRELIILKNITRVFTGLQIYQKGAELVSEVRVILNEEKVRIPDISFFTREQMLEAQEDKYPIPSFVVEINSEFDTIKRLEQKILEYFEAGVQVIWVISPATRMVRVLKSPKEISNNYTNDIVSAEPAIPGLSLTVDDVFQDYVYPED